METIAILYIAIGKYDRFWESFHTSCERYFLHGLPKTYYVFTDSNRLKNSDNVVVSRVNDEGWPGNTLHRFRFFLQQEKQLRKHDFCFFFNANARILKPVIPAEVIPTHDEEDLVGLSWRLNNGQSVKEFPYERNPRSAAYIPENMGSIYYQGGFFGGRTGAVMDLIRTLDQWIDQDDALNMTAINNDESHLNRYLLDKHPKCLGLHYGRPQEWMEPTDPSVVFIQKEHVLGPWMLFRLKDKSIRYLLKNLTSMILLYLRNVLNPTTQNRT